MTPVYLSSKASQGADDNHTTVLHFGVVQDCYKNAIPKPLTLLDIRMQQLDPETLYNKSVSSQSCHVPYSTEDVGAVPQVFVGYSGKINQLN